MRVKHFFLLSVFVVLVVGCAGHSSMMNNLRVGMTKADVIDVLGTPDYTSGKNDTEILCYKLTSGGFFRDSFFVIVKQGAVDRFGRQGDFGIYY